MKQLLVDAAWWVGDAMNDTETSVFAVTAGLGSGKTHGDAQWHHYLTTINNECRFSGFLEPTYQKINDAAIPTFQKVLQSFGMVEHSDYKIVKRPFPKLIYKKHPSKHEIHFLSAENPEKLVAVEYSHGTADEAGIIPWTAVRNFRSRLRDPKAKRRQLLLSGAPQGVNDFAEQFDSATLPGWEFLSKREHVNLSRKYKRYILWTDDNARYLPPDYLDLIQDTYGHNANLIRSYRYGEFCPLTEGAAYANYIPQKHDYKNVAADPFRDLVLTLDFNANPMAWVAVQRQPFVNYTARFFKWVVIDECNQGASNLDDAVIEFAAKFPREVYKETQILLYGDRSGHAASHKISGSDYEYIQRLLKDLGYKNVRVQATKTVAPEGASVDAVNQLFMRDLIYICNRCTKLKKSLLATTWKPGVRKLDKPSGETWTHHGDSLKYWAWQETRDETGQTKLKNYGVNT